MERFVLVDDDPNVWFEIMGDWNPIETVPKDGSEVLLGFFSDNGADMDFYRWNETLARDNVWGGDPEIIGWADRTSDPPHERPTHWMRIEPPKSNG